MLISTEAGGSNNGYYKVTEVNDALNYVRVAGLILCRDRTTASGVKVMVQSDAGHLQKGSDCPGEPAVIVNTSSVGGTTDAMYIGLAIGDGRPMQIHATGTSSRN